MIVLKELLVLLSVLFSLIQEKELSKINLTHKSPSPSIVASDGTTKLEQVEKNVINFNKFRMEYLNTKPNQDLQVILDKNKEKAILENDQELKKKNILYFVGHKESKFGQITELKTGEKIVVKDVLGLTSTYTVSEKEIIHLTNLGSGGVPKSKKEIETVNRIMNQKDTLILQTCLEVNEHDFKVLLVVAKKQ